MGVRTHHSVVWRVSVKGVPPSSTTGYALLALADRVTFPIFAREYKLTRTRCGCGAIRNK